MIRHDTQPRQYTTPLGHLKSKNIVTLLMIFWQRERGPDHVLAPGRTTAVLLSERLDVMRRELIRRERLGVGVRP